MERPLALIVDRDPTVRATVRETLERREVQALGAGTGAETEEVLKSRDVDILLVDVSMPGVDPVSLLKRQLRVNPATLLIGLTPDNDDGRGNELVRAGAFDVMPKPLDEAKLGLLVERAMRQHDVLEDLRRLRDELQSREGYQGIVGRSDAMEGVREHLDRLGAHDRPVWFVGEKGTGREHAARSLHARSARGAAPFVVVRCRGTNDAQFEALWSGGEGQPLPEQAAGGAIFLDELPALSPGSQLRIRDGRLADVRLLVSAGDSADVLVEQGRLVQPLADLLGAETVRQPPLRERAEDIAVLAGHFISTICEINHLPPIQLVPETLGLLEGYHWPENVQELRNAMEQAVILAIDGKIRPRDLPDRIREASVTDSGREAARPAATRRFREAKREVVERFEHSYLNELMERHRGNVTAASQQAGMLRSALQRLLRKYDLKSADYRRKYRAAARQDSSRSRAD